MKRICLGAGLAILLANGAPAQILPQKKTEEVFYTPLSGAQERYGSGFSEQDFSDLQWQSRNDTMPKEAALKKGVVQSETGPFRSRRSVWASETMVRRAAEFGSGKYSAEATVPAVEADRWAASQLREADFPGKADDDAILAAVYRYFFNYRKRGFAKDTTVYFLGLGPHTADAPPSVIQALASDDALKKDGVKLLPMSNVLEVTGDALRDRDSGAYGAAFRVDEISQEKDGDVKVVGTFSERDGFWFTRQFTLREGKKGWEVVKDEDLKS